MSQALAFARRDDPSDPDYGSALARQRRVRGWSQTELARPVADEIDREYSQTTVSQWERGESEVPGEVRAALAKLLGDFRPGNESRLEAGSTRLSRIGAQVLAGDDSRQREENFALWRACLGFPTTSQG